MTRFIFKFLIAGSLLVLFGNFQCEKFDCEFFYLLRDWNSTWLDNSGRQPQIAEGSSVPREAFGIRLSANLSSTGADTVLFTGQEPCYFVALHPLRQIQIIANEAFDTISAGSDISERFRVRFASNSYLQYFPLDDFAGVYYAPPDEVLTPAFHFDLLMTDPPQQAGDYRFSVHIQFDSLGTAALNIDTSFILPIITLQ